MVGIRLDARDLGVGHRFGQGLVRHREAPAGACAPDRGLAAVLVGVAEFAGADVGVALAGGGGG